MKVDDKKHYKKMQSLSKLLTKIKSLIVQTDKNLVLFWRSILEKYLNRNIQFEQVCFGLMDLKLRTNREIKRDYYCRYYMLNAGLGKS